MKRDAKKKTLIFLNPETKEMLRYLAYKNNQSQNSLIEKTLSRSLKRQLKDDEHFQELSDI